MTKPVTIPNTFATATTAIPLSQLDSDFSTVATALNDANTYSNYAADTGVANAYVVTLTGVSTTYSAGLRIQFKAGASNTGASTLNVNGGGTKNITFQDASALSSGTIAANAIVDVMYDGTQFLLMNDPAGATGGDVVGPASATDNAIVRFDGATGKLVQNSVVTIADSTGDISGVGTLNATTLDATNIEVTNIKAKDGTAAASIADSTGVISVTANPVLSGGTANGVPYLNGSKVLTSGSALTFNGTSLGVGTSDYGNAGSINVAVGVPATTTGGLQLWSTASASHYMQFGDSTAGDGPYRGAVGYNHTLDALQFFASGSEKMVLTSTGLGVGTSSPGRRLDVAGNGRVTGGNGIFFEWNNGTDATYVSQEASAEFRINQSTASANSKITFLTQGTLQATLDSFGNLGLGVTPSAWSASYKAISVGYAGGQQMAGGTGNSQALWTTNLVFTGTGATGWKLPNNVAGTAYEQYLGVHKWFNAPANGVNGDATLTQAMTLDASGRLGVGTTNPQNTFVVSNAGAEGLEVVPNASGSPELIAYNRGTASYIRLTFNSSDQVFKTSGTERARITSGGYFKASNTGSYQGSTSGYHELRTDNNTYIAYFTNSNAAPNGTVIEYGGAAPNGTGNLFLYCGDTGGERASVRSNGGLANYSGNNVNLSDRREKTNFAPAKSYLNTICAIPVQTFNYIDQSEDDPGLTLGVVAQDVQAVAPELVMESNWGTEENPKMRLSIYQTDLQYALMKCIQEQQALITSLTARVALLEGN